MSVCVCVCVMYVVWSVYGVHTYVCVYVCVHGYSIIAYIQYTLCSVCV